MNSVRNKVSFCFIFVSCNVQIGSAAITKCYVRDTKCISYSSIVPLFSSRRVCLHSINLECYLAHMSRNGA